MSKPISSSPIIGKLASADRNIRGSTVPVLVIAGLVLAWLFAGNGSQPLMVGKASAVTPHGPIPSRIVFNRDIRPILSDRCFSCHGPDPNKRQAGLRLDRPDSAMGPLPDDPKNHAFVPGDPAHSEAIKRIFTTDTDDVMPPTTSHLKLTDAEKGLIRRWVQEGEPYEEHWAFNTPIRPSVPEVNHFAWPKNDIDHFVLANLEARGLTPSREADKPTLIRRVSLDLTGIPPTPAEVDRFVKDTSPDAYEKVVDRLLASPQYGEQMATQWLDYARYADSHGYQSDPERHMWRWRDWVINAYNSNMPFDQFAIEQLAGDLLPNATMDQKIATGFNRNPRINDEGGTIAEEWRIEGVIDRVSTTSAVFMGLTMECCRCHDHKFDPITQKEFYAFCGYFNSINEIGIGPTGPTDMGINVPPVLKVPTPEQQQKLDGFADRLKALDIRVSEIRKGTPDRLAKLLAGGGKLAQPEGMVVHAGLNGDIAASDGEAKPIDMKYIGMGDPVFVEGRPGGKAVHFDGTGTAVDAGQAVNFDRLDSFTYGAWVKRTANGALLSKMDVKGDFRGFDLYLDSERVSVHIIHKWPENALKVRTTTVVPKDVWTHVMATYDGSGNASGVKIYIDGKSRPLEVLNDSLSGTIANKSPVLIGKRDGADFFTGAISDARFFDRKLSPAEVATIAQGAQIETILQTPADRRTPEQINRLSDFVESTDPDLAKAADEITAVKKGKAKLMAMVSDTMVMEELPKPRDTYVLIRGQYDMHGDKVEPGTPAVLPPLPKDAPHNRLGLARWIVDPANPLTARVQVNRFWEKYFGIGLVKTSENLGTQTEWPSNPQLLDWLATEFVRLHWDQKALQKEIVMSAAYQQVSEMTPAMLEMDPDNRLIERGPRFRLSAEQVRDQALAVSGLLVEKIGGPSARPYEPADLWAGNNFGNLATYMADKGDGLYRRTLYTFIKRSAVPANLSLFDQPSREYCVIRRSRTDTPLQALDLMNDPTYLEASRLLAQRVMQDLPVDASARIAEIFKRVTCRKPSDSELKILQAGFDRELARFKKEPDNAAKLVSVGDAPRDPKLDTAELAAYTMTSSIILNLDETITRQ